MGFRQVDEVLRGHPEPLPHVEDPTLPLHHHVRTLAVVKFPFVEFIVVVLLMEMIQRTCNFLNIKIKRQLIKKYLLCGSVVVVVVVVVLDEFELFSTFPPGRAPAVAF